MSKKRRQDNQPNDIQYNDTQYNNQLSVDGRSVEQQ